MLGPVLRAEVAHARRVQKQSQASLYYASSRRADALADRDAGISSCPDQMLPATD
jgi:hypothetical protein